MKTFLLYILFACSLSLSALEQSICPINHFDFLPNELMCLIADKVGEVSRKSLRPLNFLKDIKSFLLVCKRFNKSGKGQFIKHVSEYYKISLVHAAIRLNHVSYIEEYFKKNEKVIILKMPLLEYATTCRSLAIAQILINKEGTITSKKEGSIALQFALQNDSYEIAKLLLAYNIFTPLKN